VSSSNNTARRCGAIRSSTLLTGLFGAAGVHIANKENHTHTIGVEELELYAQQAKKWKKGCRGYLCRPNSNFCASRRSPLLGLEEKRIKPASLKSQDSGGASTQRTLEAQESKSVH